MSGKQRLWALLLAGAFLVGLSWVSLPAVAAEKDTLTIAIPIEPKILDPQLSYLQLDEDLLVNLYENLVMLDYQMRPLPLLATGWKQLDPLTWVFEIRKGVRFHNGREMTAEDVRYSYHRNMDPDLKIRRRRLPQVKSVEVLDRYRVRVNLKSPDPDFPHITLFAQLKIVPKEEVERLGERFARNPVGTGPYKLERWEPGNRFVLVRNEDYWGGVPPIRRVVVRVIPDLSVASLELEAGKVDIARQVLEEDLDRLKGNREVEVGYVLESNYYFIPLNMGQKSRQQCLREGGKEGECRRFSERLTPFKDLRVRQAFVHGVNWDEVVSYLIPRRELGQRSYSFFPAGLPFYDPSVQTLWPEYNPEKAKKLLAEAGYPRGFKAKLLFWLPGHERIGVPLQAYLKKVGIDLEVQKLEVGALVRIANEGKHDMVIIRARQPAVPLAFLYDYFHSERRGSTGNRSFYSNPEVDRLIERAFREVDPDKRLALVRRVEGILLRELPLVPLYTTARTMAWRKRVRDFRPHPAETFLFNLASPQRRVYLAD